MATPLPQQRRTLGRSGLQVSPIGLGCSGFWGHRRFPEQSAANVVEHALAQGVNLLDTGHNYSGFHAEPRLGRILRPLLKRYPRESLVISSKGVGPTTQRATLLTASQLASYDHIKHSLLSVSWLHFHEGIVTHFT